MREQIHRRASLMLMVVAGLSVSAPALARDARSFRLAGMVRDFQASHSDFNLANAGGQGSIRGLVGDELGDNGRPEFTGAGRVMTSSAMDAGGRPLMSLDTGSHSGGSETVDNFSITNRVVVPSEQFAVEMILLGAAIETGQYHLPVTAQVRIGAEVIEPFGSYASPVNGNVNDNQDVTGWANARRNPQTFRTASTYAAGTAIEVIGKSWQKTSSSVSGNSDTHWQQHFNVTSAGSADRLFVLRDGDAVPNYAALFNQASIEEYIADYIDDRGRVDLDSNQAIYLFELGTGFDYQDLVVLVSLAPTADDFSDDGGDGGLPGCVAAGGSETVLGAANNAGISSADSFRQWFADAPGVNLPKVHMIEFREVESGIFEHSTDDFAPVDSQLFGNESDSRNRNFTFAFDASFDCVACGGQFLEFAGTGDVWAFIDGELVMDLGGMQDGDRQVVDIDRLDLDPAESHSLSFFYAQRGDTESPFRIRTNLNLSGPRGMGTPTSAPMAD